MSPTAFACLCCATMVPAAYCAKACLARIVKQNAHLGRLLTLLLQTWHAIDRHTAVVAALTRATANCQQVAPRGHSVCIMHHAAGQASVWQIKGGCAGGRIKAPVVGVQAVKPRILWGGAEHATRQGGTAWHRCEGGSVGRHIWEEVWQGRRLRRLPWDCIGQVLMGANLTWHQRKARICSRRPCKQAHDGSRLSILSALSAIMTKGAVHGNQSSHDCQTQVCYSWRNSALCGTSCSAHCGP